jgi:glycine/D-amino acid oxidase-like deaminating enzyme
MTSPDVVVVGAGIVGACTAWELARRGALVTLLDRGPVSGGTTGLGEGNVLCGDKDAGPELDLAVAGMAVYAELEDVLGDVAQIRRKGSLVVHAEPRGWAGEPARVERLRAAGVEAELLDGAAARALEPELTAEILGSTHVPGDLQCAPRAITRAMAALAQEAGATVRTGVGVDEVVVEAGRVTGVRAGAERIAAGAVVLAAGAWSAPLARTAGLALPVVPRKGQLVRLSLPEPDERFLRKKVVEGSYLASVLSADAGLELSTVVETTADGHVLVGASRERAGFDATVSAELSGRLQERAARLVPALAGLRAADAWVGFRPWLPDHLPAIGASAAVPGLWVGTGHEGAGICLGPITGRVLAQALCGERPAAALEAFAPDRFA